MDEIGRAWWMDLMDYVIHRKPHDYVEYGLALNEHEHH
jgi:hypothetical protein